MPITEPLPVCLRGVSKCFRPGGRELWVVQDVDLSVQAGEFVSVMGPSGSGKTTLLQLIAGLEPPTAGSIHLLGHDLLRLDDAGLARLRREALGYAFQFFNLLPTLSVGENVALPLVLAKVPRPVALERAHELLTRLRLSARSEDDLAHLSGGELRRVSLARALVHRPQVLLADEPTGNLDSAEAEDLLELLQSLRRQEGFAILMTSHNARVAAYAERTFKLRSGRLSELRREAGFLA